MSAKKSGSGGFDAQKFVQSLETLIDALPSESHKEQVVSQLETLIQFLGELKSRLASLPTQQDAASARVALNALAPLFAQVKTNPVLGTAIGFRTTPQQRKPSAITPHEVERAKVTIARFEGLPIDQIRASLNEMNVNDLKAIASALSVRSTQRTTRDALAHQIATRIANTRGYRSLRDGTE